MTDLIPAAASFGILELTAVIGVLEEATIGDLNQETLTVCDYVVNYKGTFENNPYQDTGWIYNTINCTGYDPGHYVYLIVHETDPRFRDNPEWSEWGTWEYHALTESGNGNLVRPKGHL